VDKDASEDWIDICDECDDTTGTSERLLIRDIRLFGNATVGNA
jgi:hypothetical protein